MVGRERWECSRFDFQYQNKNAGKKNDEDDEGWGLIGVTFSSLN
jgi:hypothetical protein